MNETGAVTTPLILVVWLWCLVAFIPAFWAGRRGVFRVLRVSGVVALVAFAVFWIGLIENDSASPAYPVGVAAVVAVPLWWLRRWTLVALLMWGSCAVLAATGFGFMVFFGPAPLAVVVTMAALFAGKVE